MAQVNCKDMQAYIGKDRRKMTAVISVVLWCAVILGVLYLLAIMPRMLHKPDTEPFKKVLYAHRGLFDNATNAPENSLGSLSEGCGCRLWH